MFINMFIVDDFIFSFFNLMIGVISYFWNFGDGLIFMVVFLLYIFLLVVGNYDIVFIVIDVVGCSSIFFCIIYVDELFVYFVLNVFMFDVDEFNQIFQLVFVFGFDLYDYNMIIFN